MLGYCVCQERGDNISIFYVISPILLITGFFLTWNLGDIVHAILHFEGVV